MSIPILVTWADAELVESDSQIWWGFKFEMIVGASGFHAQNRLHGFCGFKADLMPSDGSFISGNDLPSIISARETKPEQLQPYVSDICDAYLAYMRHLGLALSET